MLRLAYSDRYTLLLPEGHRFPIAKYGLVHDQLRYEGLAGDAHFFDPGLCPEAEVLRVHARAYYERVRDQQLSPAEVRQLGLPQTERLFLRSLSSSAGTLQAALAALEHGIGMNLAGGTHHAFADRPEGFCVFNDLAIAAAHLLHHGLARQVLIVDLDVHQGNGTAQIFRHEPRVFTFSMHGRDNYPLRKEASDLDVPLPPGTGDEAYLGLLRQHLPALMERVRPDFVFFQAGVDVLATDRLGKLGLTKAGCKTRDELVLATCQQRGVPVATCLGGGYSAHLADVVDAHCNTFRVAHGLFG
jgi:acetoin utilization deacetylase AcuC-like enzyme